jgi:HSP20 family molecular chaperone IbpA
MQRKRKDLESRTSMETRDDHWLILIRQQGNRPFRPPTDVIELADRLVILIEIAGLRTIDLNVTLLERQVVISVVR